jgi:hypothetical protein
MSDVRLDGGAHLRSDGLVGAQKWHVTVCGATGDDLDEAGVVEVAEASDDVSVKGAEVFECLREETMPEPRSLRQVSLAGLDEVGFVFAGGDDLAIEIVGKFRDEDRMRELFEKDWREIEIAVEADLVPFQIAKDSKQRKIGLRGGLVKPLHTMRPGAVVDYVRQMGVQRKGKIPCRSFCGGGRCLRQDGALELGWQAGLCSWCSE